MGAALNMLYRYLGKMMRFWEIFQSQTIIELLDQCQICYEGKVFN